MGDRPELNGQRGRLVKWYDPVKRWKVKLEDGSVMMCRGGELSIDESQVLSGGYKLGDHVLSRMSHSFKSGGQLRQGDEGVVLAPGGENSQSGLGGDLRLCVGCAMGRVIMLATSIRPVATQLSPAEFEVHLDRDEDAQIGVGLCLELAQDGCTLIIKSISPGLVEDWNSRSDPENIISVGDRIVEVNGLRGEAAQLVSLCRQCLSLTLIIMRCSSMPDSLE